MRKKEQHSSHICHLEKHLRSGQQGYSMLKLDCLLFHIYELCKNLISILFFQLLKWLPVENLVLVIWDCSLFRVYGKSDTCQVWAPAHSEPKVSAIQWNCCLRQLKYHVWYIQICGQIKRCRKKYNLQIRIRMDFCCPSKIHLQRIGLGNRCRHCKMQQLD